MDHPRLRTDAQTRRARASTAQGALLVDKGMNLAQRMRFASRHERADVEREFGEFLRHLVEDVLALDWLETQVRQTAADTETESNHRICVSFKRGATLREHIRAEHAQVNRELGW